MSDLKLERPSDGFEPIVSSRRRRPVFTVVVLCLTFWLLVPGISSPSTPASLFTEWRSASLQSPGEPENQQAFRWSDISPSKSLVYTPCFGPYQCARLSVPLNWNASAEDRDNGPRAAIAITKLPAKVPVTDPRYGGVVVLNPGGPGESGVFQVLSDGPHLQTVLDSPASPSEKFSQSGKHFDILSFDPRGVNNTTPELRCFPNAFNKQTWQLRFIDMGLLWDSESIVGLEWARSSALGASCSSGQSEESILPFINTAQVVEDMVEIIEKEGELRAQEASRILASQTATEDSLSTEEVKAILQRTSYTPGQEKIQYWGMSYGTTVGSTFAAMHPDKVHRLILDGNMDPADHYAGLFEHSLQDADMVITKHSEYCYEAGPEECPLYDASPKAIEARMTSIMESIKTGKHSNAIDVLVFERVNCGNPRFPPGIILIHLIRTTRYSFAHQPGSRGDDTW